MDRDPIVEETRKHREEYAEKFNNDPAAIFADIKRRQLAAGKTLTRLPPRKPRQHPAPA